MTFIAGTVIIAAALIAAGGTAGAIAANNAKEAAAEKEETARQEMDRQKQLFKQLDTSNPYANMENMMEDLAINQQQAQFEKNMQEQQQANILQTLKGAAGGSGVAALAQAMANQGTLAAQRASASIGAQEAANQRLAAQEAASLQRLQREGDIWARGQKRDITETLLGMSQGETAAARAERLQASAAEQAAYASVVEGGASLGTSYLGTV